MNSAQRRERLQQFEVLCRRLGLSRTVQRRVTFEATLDRRDHPTADQVHDRVQQRIPGVSRTTVYRILETLVEIGVITKVCSPGATMRFDPRTERHHHLVCLRCDKLIDLDDHSVRHRIASRAAHPHAFHIQDFSIHFYGICAACRPQPRRRAAKSPATPSHPGGAPRRKSTRARRPRRTDP